MQSIEIIDYGYTPTTGPARHGNQLQDRDVLDNAFNVALGDRMNGYQAEATVGTVDEAVKRLIE